MRPFAAALLVAAAVAPAAAVELGPLTLLGEEGGRASAEVRLLDVSPADAPRVGVRVAHADAFRSIGLPYDARLEAVRVRIEPNASAGPTARLDGLPLQREQPLAIVLLASDAGLLRMAGYRIDVKSGNGPFAAVDPGTLSVPAMATAVATRLPAAATPLAGAAAPGAKPSRPPPADPETERAVADALTRWAEAWSRRDMQAYVAAYVDEYAGRGARTHAQWVADRTQRIAAKRSIEVAVSDLRITVNGDRADARFVQRYRGDALVVTSRKRLGLQRIDGAWRIREEAEL